MVLGGYSMNRFSALFVVAVMAATTARADSDLADIWRLAAIDGLSFAGRATLDLTEDGRISGQAPCNRYFGANQSTLPAFNPGALASTKMACPDLALEDAFLDALSAMTSATLGKDDILMLSGAGGRTMAFSRDPG